MSPKYSFIMPAYKSIYLKGAIDSILNQSYKDFELVIVNDASPENIDVIIKNYSDERIRYYVNEENVGGKNLVAQWNRCLSHAQGEFVILATDDDEYMPDYLEKMNILTDKYPSVDAFRPRITHIGGGQTPDIECYMPEYSTRNIFLYFFFKRYISTGIGFWIFRKSKLDEIGGYQDIPAAWFADDITVMALSNKGVVMSNDILFKFRIHSQAISDKHNDANLLEMKLHAHEDFENYYKEYFLRYPEKDAEISDSILLQLADILNRQIWFYDINRSSKKAIIKNRRLISRTSKLSQFLTIRLILNKLLH